MKKCIAIILALLIGFISGYALTIKTAIPLVEPETEHILIVDEFGLVWEYKGV